MRASADRPPIAGADRLHSVGAADNTADLHVVEPVAESLRGADFAYLCRWRPERPIFGLVAARKDGKRPTLVVSDIITVT